MKKPNWAGVPAGQRTAGPHDPPFCYAELDIVGQEDGVRKAVKGQVAPGPSCFLSIRKGGGRHCRTAGVKNVWKNITTPRRSVWKPWSRTMN